MSTAEDFPAQIVRTHSDDVDAGQTNTKDSNHNDAGASNDDKKIGVIKETDFDKSDYKINLENNILLMEFPKDVVYGYVVLNIFGIWENDSLITKGRKRFYTCLVIFTVLLQIMIAWTLAWTADFATDNINDAELDGAFFKFDNKIENIHMSVVSIDTSTYDNYTNNSMAQNYTTWLNSTQNINDTTTDTDLGDYIITLDFGSRFKGKMADELDSSVGTLLVKLASFCVITIYCIRDALSHLPFIEFMMLTRKMRIRKSIANESLNQLHVWGFLAAGIQSGVTYLVAWPASYMIAGASDGFSAITNCVAAVFILEIDNWMYDILSNRMTVLNDKLFTVKFKISQELQRKLMNHYENSRMKTNLMYICYVLLPVGASLVLLLSSQHF